MQLELPPEIELVLGEDEAALWPENEIYLSAWQDMENIRPQGMSGIVGIQPSEIESWARHCWDLNVPEFVRRMLKVQAEKDAAEKAKNGK
jgi:hypothetical protein